MRKALGVAMLILSLPVPAQAQAPLALRVASPADLKLTHTATATSNLSLKVITPLLSWSLSIKDGRNLTPGHLDQVTCGTDNYLPKSLQEPLIISPLTAPSFPLSGAASLVATGNRSQDLSLTLSQSLGPTEALTKGECFKTQLVITVTT